MFVKEKAIAYVGHALGVEVYLVDEPQIVDVDRNLGVVYVLKREHYLVLDIQYLFGCHLLYGFPLPHIISLRPMP